MNDCSELLKADVRSQCGKRSRFQACPTYILNLTCPRAHYDLSFEPAKTCVEFKDWDRVFTFIKKAVSCFWSEEDDIWNGADTSSARDDILNNDRFPKKRCMTRCNQDSIILSSPQLEMSREESKHMPLVRYSCNRSQRNAVQFEDYGYVNSEDIYLENKEHVDLLSDSKQHPNSLHTGSRTSKGLLVKHASSLSSHCDDEIMKPFLRSCSSRMDTLSVAKSTRGEDNFRFQADKFKKWLCMDDNRLDIEEETDYTIQGSEPWLDDDVTIWSPPRITTSKGPFDTLLTGADCLTEDNSNCVSPVASIQDFRSSHRSSNGDWSFGEQIHVDPLTDVVSKRHFGHGRNDEFDLFAHEEDKMGIFNFDYTRCSSSWDNFKNNTRNSQKDSILSPQQCDFLYESDWTRSPVASSHHVPSSSYADRERSKIAHCRTRDKQRRRSCSAPPFYKEKRKIIALNSWMTDKSYHETLNNAPMLQVSSHLKHTQKSPASDLQSKARHDKKKTIDKAEISDYEGKVVHHLDVYNTDLVFTLKENQDGLDVGVKWRNDCPLTSSIQKPSDLANQEKILDISSGILHLFGVSLLPKSTSKKFFEDCRVLYQVDKKFIPVVGGGILADQHAADERIRLEDLREKVLSGEIKTVTYLDAEQELVLPEIGYQLLNNYSEQIQKWGWICNFHAQSSVSFKKNLNFLNNQPSVATLIAVPCILGVNLTDVDLLEFLQQLADTDGSSVIPPAVLRVLIFKACRGAIMFGDALLPSECSLIVEELKKTSMCFQCAHGRPTTAPLVNLVALHKQIANLGSSGPLHGLSRHRPSLERAAQRLSQC